MDTISIDANKAALDLLKEIEQLEFDRSIINGEMYEKKQLLPSLCIHPEKDIEKKHYYREGGYLDRGYHDNWTACSICGKQMTEKVRTDAGYA